jgi:hypothetical protein
MYILSVVIFRNTNSTNQTLADQQLHSLGLHTSDRRQRRQLYCDGRQETRRELESRKMYPTNSQEN